jgi:hypothetical protein
MIRDYAQYLLRNKRYESIKINQRIIHVLELLIIKGPIELKKFLNSPEVQGIYGKQSASTQSRDLVKMIMANLIKVDKDKGVVEVNYTLLDSLTYNV